MSSQSQYTKYSYESPEPSVPFKFLIWGALFFWMIAIAAGVVGGFLGAYQ